MKTLLFLVSLLLLPVALYADMYARYDTTNLRLKHWSTVPFTTPPGPNEADKAFPDGTKRPDGLKSSVPARVNSLRLKANLSGLEIDPTIPVPPQELKRKAAKAKLKAMQNDPTLSVGLREALKALEDLR